MIPHFCSVVKTCDGRLQDNSGGLETHLDEAAHL